MQNDRLIPALAITVITLLITACGGGGGSGGETNASNSKQTNSSSVTQSSSSNTQISSAPSLSSLDRANTPLIAGAYLDLLSFAKETAVSIVNGEYQVALTDGVYKDSCEGGGGSFDITVSDNGNRLTQKYTNCLLSVSTGGKAETLLISGEESIITTRNENGPSTVNITWKNYSVKNDGEPPLTIDGSFIYEGLLYFSSQITYKNVTSRIKIDAKVNDGGEMLDAKNVDFVFDYPAIFDQYEGAGFGYVHKPDVLHIFTQTIATAKGSLWVNGVGANFNLNATDKKVTFSNEGTAKSYLDGEPKGFFIQWDKNNDALFDAIIFLTETEYPAILDMTDAENNDIYFTRYLNDYGTPYPTNHGSTGYYQPVELSRGATTEIDVRELFTSKSGALLTYEIDNENISQDWEQLEAGKFLLKFPNSNGTENFKLNVTAVDMNGNRSPVIQVNVRMNDNLADFDKDGVPDYKDPDIDNDGTPNHTDNFPKDPTENSDIDRDGIGDNADTDRDNDDVANQDDAYPNDGACSKPESGNGESCYLTHSHYRFTDKNGVAYFSRDIGDSSISGKSQFVRFDTINKVFLTPTSTFNWSADYSYGELYDAESHSIIISNNTHDGYQIWQHVSVLNLNDFTVTAIDNSRNHNMHAAFHDHGYWVFAVTSWNEPTNFRWIETYSPEGQLVDSSEVEARATPQADTYYNLQHSTGVGFCSYSISVDSTGNIIQTGLYENRYSDDCESVVQVSENGMYGYSLNTSSFLIHEASQPSILIEGHHAQWLNNTIVYIENYTGDLIAKNIPLQETRTLSAEQVNGKDVYVSGKNILLMRPTSYGITASMLLYNEELQLIYDSSQF